MAFSPLPPQLHRVLVRQSRKIRGDGSHPEAGMDKLYEIIAEEPARWLTVEDDFAPPVKIWSRAAGQKEGRAAQCTCWLLAPVWEVGGYQLTSVALAAAALQILRGKVRSKGVLAAETAFDPLPYLNDVASLLPESLPEGRLVGHSFQWLE